MGAPQNNPRIKFGTLANRPLTNNVPQGMVYVYTDLPGFFAINGPSGWDEIANPSAPTVVYVDLAGDDANSGLSPLLPKRTLPNALHSAPIARGSLMIQMGGGDFGETYDHMVSAAILADSVTPPFITVRSVNPVPVPANPFGTTTFTIDPLPGALTLPSGTHISWDSGAVTRLNARVAPGATSITVQNASFFVAIPAGNQGVVEYPGAENLGQTIVRGTLISKVSLVTTAPTIAPSFGRTTIPTGGTPYLDQYRGLLIDTSPPSFGGPFRVSSNDTAGNLTVDQVIAGPGIQLPLLAAGTTLILSECATKLTLRHNDTTNIGANFTAAGSQFTFDQMWLQLGNVPVGNNTDDCFDGGGNFLFRGCLLTGDDALPRNTHVRYLSCNLALNPNSSLTGQVNGAQWWNHQAFVTCVVTGMLINCSNADLSVDSSDFVACQIRDANDKGQGGVINMVNSYFRRVLGEINPMASALVPLSVVPAIIPIYSLQAGQPLEIGQTIIFGTASVKLAARAFPGDTSLSVVDVPVAIPSGTLGATYGGATNGVVDLVTADAPGAAPGDVTIPVVALTESLQYGVRIVWTRLGVVTGAVSSVQLAAAGAATSLFTLPLNIAVLAGDVGVVQAVYVSGTPGPRPVIFKRQGSIYAINTRITDFDFVGIFGSQTSVACDSALTGTGREGSTAGISLQDASVETQGTSTTISGTGGAIQVGAQFTITENGGGVAPGAVAITVTPLLGSLPIGARINWAGKEVATLTAAAAKGATVLAVAATVVAIAAGETGHGPAISSHAEVNLLPVGVVDPNTLCRAAQRAALPG